MGSKGEVKVPTDTVDALRSPDAWYPMSDIVFSADKITAKYRLAPLRSPRLEIDRVGGEIQTLGAPSTFHGICRPYDPAAVRNAF